MIFKKNSKEKEILKMCRYCFMCRHACPVFLETKMDSNTPRGHALLISRIDENISEWTEDTVDKIYQCSQCSLCKELCEFSWEEDTLIQSTREMIVKLKIVPDEIKKLKSFLINYNINQNKSPNVFDINNDRFDRKHIDVLYLAGYSTLFEQPEIIKKTADVLNSIGIKWTMFKEEGIAGIELFELGYTKEAKIAAKKLINKILEIKPKIIITGNPHVYKTLKSLTPQWDIDYLSDIKIYHIVEYLYLKIKDRTLKLKKNPNFSKIIYHDPCQLGRNMGVYDEPRELIKLITGNPPLEFLHSRNEAECCGAGSVMYLTHPDITRKMAQIIIYNALEMNAKTIVTACPNCKKVFEDASIKTNSNLKVIDIIELISL